MTTDSSMGAPAVLFYPFTLLPSYFSIQIVFLVPVSMPVVFSSVPFSDGYLADFYMLYAFCGCWAEAADALVIWIKI